jgi:hypothetical protein
METVFFVKSYHRTWTFKGDEAFLTPSLALQRAKELSLMLPDTAVVSFEAHNWVVYDRGEVVKVYKWEDRYLGPPSERYKALMAAMGEVK